MTNNTPNPGGKLARESRKLTDERTALLRSVVKARVERRKTNPTLVKEAVELSERLLQTNFPALQRDHAEIPKATLRTLLAALPTDDDDTVFPDILAEGERLANETPKTDGAYLWTDLVGAIQTAIAEERARHVRSA